MTEKKSVLGTIKEGFAESTRNVHEINKENMAAVKADAKANFKAATTPDPSFEKFKQAKGLGNKIKVIGQNVKESAAKASEKEEERRAEIRSHEAYKTILEEQRNSRQSIIKGVTLG